MNATLTKADVEKQYLIEERAAIIAEIRALESLIMAKKQKAALLAKRAGLTIKA